MDRWTAEQKIILLFWKYFRKISRGYSLVCILLYARYWRWRSVTTQINVADTLSGCDVCIFHFFRLIGVTLARSIEATIYPRKRRRQTKLIIIIVRRHCCLRFSLAALLINNFFFFFHPIRSAYSQCSTFISCFRCFLYKDSSRENIYSHRFFQLLISPSTRALYPDTNT